MIVTGIGSLSHYSTTINLQQPITVANLPELMKIHESLYEHIIAVKGRKVLSLDEMLHDSDEIKIFISVSGG